ncbi:hypothetical protein [Methylosinus sp. C49]|uniref:hypothetical protein n=1 Tax=Methylosinus sp. C49 TaxID=2699395 RepID=UPI001FCE36C0|nr:hypothetical protein [Methylosinus sp. C49]
MTIETLRPLSMCRDRFREARSDTRRGANARRVDDLVQRRRQIVHFIGESDMREDLQQMRFGDIARLARSILDGEVGVADLRRTPLKDRRHAVDRDFRVSDPLGRGETLDPSTIGENLGQQHWDRIRHHGARHDIPSDEPGHMAEPQGMIGNADPQMRHQYFDIRSRANDLAAAERQFDAGADEMAFDARHRRDAAAELAQQLRDANEIIVFAQQIFAGTDAPRRGFEVMEIETGASDRAGSRVESDLETIEGQLVKSAKRLIETIRRGFRQRIVVRRVRNNDVKHAVAGLVAQARDIREPEHGALRLLLEIDVVLHFENSDRREIGRIEKDA